MVSVFLAMLTITSIISLHHNQLSLYISYLTKLEFYNFVIFIKRISIRKKITHLPNINLLYHTVSGTVSIYLYSTVDLEYYTNETLLYNQMNFIFASSAFLCVLLQHQKRSQIAISATSVYVQLRLYFCTFFLLCCTLRRYTAKLKNFHLFGIHHRFQ